MSGSTEPPRAKPPRSRARGCLLWFLGVVGVMTLVVVAIGFAFDQGSDANTGRDTYDAGPADEYPTSLVIPVLDQHLYITRLADGSFVALYDKSPRQQELRGDCRVHWDPNSPTGSATQLAGFTGGFVEDCAAEGRTVWLADGTFAFGTGYGDLDRFDTRVDSSGNLVVQLDSRTCTRSRGVIGVPPFDVTRCGEGG